MDQIRDMIGRIGELSAEELQQLSETIVTEFETVSEAELTSEVVDQMTELADASDAVKVEQDRRAEEAAELSRRRDEAAARVRGTTSEEDSAEVDTSVDADSVTEASVTTEATAESESVPEAELATETPSEAEASAEAEPVAEAAATEPVEAEAAVVAETTTELAVEAPAEAVEASETHTEAATSTDGVEEAATEETLVASATSTEEDSGKDQEAAVTASAETGPDVQAPADRRPTPKAHATVAITAGADIPGVSAGSDLPNLRAVSEALVKRLHTIRRATGGDGETHTIATFNTTYPEDRQLRDGESDANNRKIESVVSPEAITAAGGFCAPVETKYDIYGFGVTDRPVKDALASFTADRGGLRHMSAPVLGDLAAAVDLWTEADDIAADPDTPATWKAELRVDCNSETVVKLDAITLQLLIGNLMTRAYPELVDRNNELAMIEHARFSENRLLTRIGTLSTAVTAAATLGVSRDFFNYVERAAVAYRSRHRLLPSHSLRVIAPHWLRAAIRSDLVMEMPGNGRDENFNLADSKINSWFAARSINVSWTLDGPSGQTFGAQTAGALLGYPSDVVWYLFSEGTFLHLDGGTLDLGLVRDSTLNSTNDYKMFVETFEAVAKVGIESLKVTQTFAVNGTAAALT